MAGKLSVFALTTQPWPIFFFFHFLLDDYRLSFQLVLAIPTTRDEEHSAEIEADIGPKLYPAMQNGCRTICHPIMLAFLTGKCFFFFFFFFFALQIHQNFMWVETGGNRNVNTSSRMYQGSALWICLGLRLAPSPFTTILPFRWRRVRLEFGAWCFQKITPPRCWALLLP